MSAIDFARPLITRSLTADLSAISKGDFPVFHFFLVRVHCLKRTAVRRADPVVIFRARHDPPAGAGHGFGLSRQRLNSLSTEPNGLRRAGELDGLEPTGLSQSVDMAFGASEVFGRLTLRENGRLIHNGLLLGKVGVDRD
jgi:hypothetical protein